MKIAIKRAYAEPEESDGYRVLIDRLWPRGISKDEAQLDDWLKEIAPSDELRKWFGHDAGRWEVRNRYLAELKEQRERVRELVENARKKQLTLVYAARDVEHTNAVVLREYMRMLGR